MLLLKLEIEGDLKRGEGRVGQRFMPLLALNAEVAIRHPLARPLHILLLYVVWFGFY